MRAVCCGIETKRGRSVGTVGSISVCERVTVRLARMRLAMDNGIIKLYSLGQVYYSFT
jgi:hypothetical protein